METKVRGHSRRERVGVTSGNKVGAVTDLNSSVPGALTSKWNRNATGMSPSLKKTKRKY